MAARPSIKLNGVALPPQMIAAEAQHHPASTPAAAFTAAAHALIVRTLLLEQAKRQGIVAEPQFLAPGKCELDDEAVIRTLIEDHVPAREPDKSECRTYYEAHRTRFRAQDLFEVSHILFRPDANDANGDLVAAKKAAAAIRELEAEPSRFDGIARSRSECDSRTNGGRLGQISSGDTFPEFEDALTSLQEGEITQSPVKTRFGWHVIRLDARAVGEILPFEYVQEEIAAYLTEQDWRRRVGRYISGLIKDASIEGIEMNPSSESKAA